MKKDFYTKSYGKLASLLECIRKNGVPSKANKTWLNTHGYTSSNDATFTSVLKALGFLDKSNVPTQRWRDYRGSNPRSVLGEALKEAYDELFATLPNACNRDDNELSNFFRARTDSGDDVVRRTIRTFKALCSQADLDSDSLVEANSPNLVDNTGDDTDVSTTSENPMRVAHQASPSLHIDIQIHISPESSADQIDQIFASMAKHLYNKSEV